jgi:hypothetical protein
LILKQPVDGQASPFGVVYLTDLSRTTSVINIPAMANTGPKEAQAAN